MPNMDPKKCPMPVQDPEVRNKNFSEVALGYTAEMAVNEAKRCLHCKNKPCLLYTSQAGRKGKLCEAVRRRAHQRYLCRVCG